jgi:hypothetical protein
VGGYDGVNGISGMYSSAADGVKGLLGTCSSVSRSLSRRGSLCRRHSCSKSHGTSSIEFAEGGEARKRRNDRYGSLIIIILKSFPSFLLAH